MNVAQKLRVDQIVREEDSDGWRWYTRGDQRFISVTQVLDVASHQRLNAWRTNNSKNKIQKTMQATAKIGTEIHDLVERDLKGQKVDELPELLDVPFQEWKTLKEEKNIKALLTEQTVVSEKYGFAGSLDIFGTGNFRKPFNVMDLKTGYYSVKAGWQMAAYRQAFLEQNKYSPDEVGMVGIQVHRDGGKVNVFEYEHYDFCLRTFLSCLEVFKGMYFTKLKKMEWPWLTQPALNLS